MISRRGFFGRLCVAAGGAILVRSARVVALLQRVVPSITGTTSLGGMTLLDVMWSYYDEVPEGTRQTIAQLCERNVLLDDLPMIDAPLDVGGYEYRTATPLPKFELDWTLGGRRRRGTPTTFRDWSRQQTASCNGPHTPPMTMDLHHG